MSKLQWGLGSLCLICLKYSLLLRVSSTCLTHESSSAKYKIKTKQAWLCWILTQWPEWVTIKSAEYAICLATRASCAINSKTWCDALRSVSGFTKLVQWLKSSWSGNTHKVAKWLEIFKLPLQNWQGFYYLLQVATSWKHLIPHMKNVKGSLFSHSLAWLFWATLKT